MKYAAFSCAASQKSTDMSLEDLWCQVLMESAKLSPVLLCNQLKLCTACAMLTLLAGNKELNLVMWHWIQGMLGLNLYLDEGLELSWRNSSMVVSKAQGHGNNHA